MTRRILILMTILVAQAIPAVAQSREKSLDRWLDRELVPYVQQQLIRHPRFKNETVMFVVLRDNAPASASNALALALRDRLLAAAVDTPGVAVGWQQGRSGSTLESQPQDCRGPGQRQCLDYGVGPAVRSAMRQKTGHVARFFV